MDNLTPNRRQENPYNEVPRQYTSPLPHQSQKDEKDQSLRTSLLNDPSSFSFIQNIDFDSCFTQITILGEGAHSVVKLVEFNGFNEGDISYVTNSQTHERESFSSWDLDSHLSEDEGNLIESTPPPVTPPRDRRLSKHLVGPIIEKQQLSSGSFSRSLKGFFNKMKLSNKPPPLSLYRKDIYRSTLSQDTLSIQEDDESKFRKNKPNDFFSLPLGNIGKNLLRREVKLEKGHLYAAKFITISGILTSPVSSSKKYHPQDFFEDCQSVLTEFRVLCKLSCPNIINVYDLLIDDHRGIPVLIIEYYDSITLEDLISNLIKRSRRQVDDTNGKLFLPINSVGLEISPPIMPELILAILFYELGGALVYLHGRRIVHRDIKPSNILVSNTFIHDCIHLLINNESADLIQSDNLNDFDLFSPMSNMSSPSASSRNKNILNEYRFSCETHAANLKQKGRLLYSSKTEKLKTENNTTENTTPIYHSRRPRCSDNSMNLTYERGLTDFISNFPSAVKLADFNIATCLTEGIGLTATGTLEYTAPEVALDYGQSEISDMWSLGLCLYYSCVGHSAHLEYPGFHSIKPYRSRHNSTSSSDSKHLKSSKSLNTSQTRKKERQNNDHHRNSDDGTILSNKSNHNHITTSSSRLSREKLKIVLSKFKFDVNFFQIKYPKCSRELGNVLSRMLQRKAECRLFPFEFINHAFFHKTYVYMNNSQ